MASLYYSTRSVQATEIFWMIIMWYFFTLSSLCWLYYSTEVLYIIMISHQPCIIIMISNEKIGQILQKIGRGRFWKKGRVWPRPRRLLASIVSKVPQIVDNAIILTYLIGYEWIYAEKYRNCILSPGHLPNFPHDSIPVLSSVVSLCLHYPINWVQSAPNRPQYYLLTHLIVYERL